MTPWCWFGVVCAAVAFGLGILVGSEWNEWTHGEFSRDLLERRGDGA